MSFHYNESDQARREIPNLQSPFLQPVPLFLSNPPLEQSSAKPTPSWLPSMQIISAEHRHHAPVHEQHHAQHAHYAHAHHKILHHHPGQHPYVASEHGLPHPTRLGQHPYVASEHGLPHPTRLEHHPYVASEHGLPHPTRLEHPPVKAPPPADRADARTNQTELPAGAKFEQIKEEAARLEGKSPLTLDAGIDPRLGCAITVSALTHTTYGLPRTASVAVLEEEMQQRSYERFPLNGGTAALQPGDIIVGHRSTGQGGPTLHSHTAMYMGDGQVFNNNAVHKDMRTEPLSIFCRPLRDANGTLHQTGYSDVWVYRPRVA